jgi:hypothetical protein
MTKMVNGFTNIWGFTFIVSGNKAIAVGETLKMRDRKMSFQPKEKPGSV